MFSTCSETSVLYSREYVQLEYGFGVKMRWKNPIIRQALFYWCKYDKVQSMFCLVQNQTANFKSSMDKQC